MRISNGYYVPRHAPLTTVGLFTALLMPATAWANVCRIPADMAAPDLAARREAPDTPTVLSGDEAQGWRQEGRFELRGDALAERADQTLGAELLHYDSTREKVVLEGAVRYQEVLWELEASQGEFYLDDNRGWFLNPRFRLNQTYAHGEAQRMDVADSYRISLDKAAYSPCPPGEEDWWLRASRIDLNRESGFGTARNARVVFKGVPIFYFPYISFPIDDRRKTGFLYPSFTSSGDDGAGIRLPWYWNIAPSFDMTFTPYFIEERGLLLGTEARLLLPYAEGLAQLEYIADDSKAEEDRWLGHLEAKSRGTPLHWELDATRLGDNEFLSDFDTAGIGTLSQSHVESWLTADYARSNWLLTARMQHFQTIDEDIGDTALPYRRLPELNADYRPGPSFGWLQQEANLGWTRFDHPYADLKDTGDRFAARYTLSAPLNTPGYYLTPSLALDHVSYQLDRPNPDADVSPSRTLPIFKIDSGIFLERDTRWSGWMQTLEPRLQYLYVPYEDQTELPRFDTGTQALSVSTLFADNRFSGPDRLGDANQVAASITSRLLEPSGMERAQLTVGQLFYYEDREVQLGAGAPSERSESEIFTDWSVRGPWHLRHTGQWVTDPKLNLEPRLDLTLALEPEPDRFIRAAYRRREDGNGLISTEQTDIAGVWRLSPKWHVLGRWNYSILEDISLEQLLGVQYNNCCWSARVIMRENTDPNDIDENGELVPDRSIMVQLDLITLGAFGRGSDEDLSGSIDGYRGMNY